MASIERTAYPRFKKRPTSKELRDVYSPTPEENQFAHKVARGPVSVLSLIVMLKSFQRLGYIPRPKDIPIEIVTHIRTCLNLYANVEPNYNSKSIYRHQNVGRSTITC